MAVCTLIAVGNSEGESLHVSQVANQAGACPGFCGMKQLGVFLLPPGWDASRLQCYFQY